MFLADLLCMLLQYLQTVMLVNYLACRKKFLLNICNMLFMYNLACLTFIRCLEDVLFGFLGHISELKFRVWLIIERRFWSLLTSSNSSLHTNTCPCCCLLLSNLDITSQTSTACSKSPLEFAVLCCMRVLIGLQSSNLCWWFYRPFPHFVLRFLSHCFPTYELSKPLESLFSPFSIISKKCLGCFIHFL